MHEFMSLCLLWPPISAWRKLPLSILFLMNQVFQHSMFPIKGWWSLKELVPASWQPDRSTQLNMSCCPLLLIHHRELVITWHYTVVYIVWLSLHSLQLKLITLNRHTASCLASVTNRRKLQCTTRALKCQTLGCAVCSKKKRTHIS